MTRKEALKKIRQMSLPKETMEILEALAPELAESDDERIRKALVWHLKADVDFVSNGVTKAECLAYLEKQKEQKPVEKPINWTELTWKDIVELEGIINNVHYEFRNGIGQESFGKEVLEKFREYKGDEYLDEIEQKPAEWSEDERIRKRLIEYFEGFRMDDVEVKWEGLIVQDVLAWLEKQKEQKPAEWSEEDETAFGDLMWCINQAAKSAKDENDMGNIWFAENWVKNRLKSLRPQPKQEWSEEDEKDMAHIIRILDDCYVYGTHDLSKTDRENLVNKLKSLRPSWKPNEEQMKALNEIVDILAASPFLHQNDYLFNILNGLRKELKKLL